MTSPAPEPAGSAERLRRFLTGNAAARTAGFALVKAALKLYRIYLERVMHKPKSARIFADENLPLGLVRAGILKGLGVPGAELRGKPLVGIANSWTELNPGHAHLNRIAAAVKQGVSAAGGVPFEFNVPAPCDALANGNPGMNYILAQRDLIADMIETYTSSQWLDGLVTISSCDKINPGMLMAAARLDLPAVCVTGGPNAMAIRFHPDSREKGIDEKGHDDLARKLDSASCATCGSCELMATANTIQALMEAMGMALPQSALAPAFSSQKLELAHQAGGRVVELIRRGIKPSAIMTAEALENAVMVDLAIGGSTNSTLHLPALAHELGIPFNLDIFNRLNRVVPTLLSISPNGPHGVIDLYMAGGVPAVMQRLAAKLHRDCLTVSGETIGEIADRAKIRDERVIPPLDRPFFHEGGTAVLFGSLAPDGAVVKQSAVAPEMLVFSGPARVFDNETAALEAITRGEVPPGTVVVLRFLGPKGAPGMPELLAVTALIDALKLPRVALVTDARFSGASKGPCVGHVSPEAYVGGPLARVRDGDPILIDIPARRLELRVPSAELAARTISAREEPPLKGYLKRYRQMVGSAAGGAVLGGEINN